MNDLGRDHCLEEVLERRVTQLLEIGAPYNKESGLDRLEDQLNVRFNIRHGNEFQILDQACCISVNIPWKDPEFNLIKWYGAELLKVDLQESQKVLSRSSGQEQLEQQDQDSTPGDEINGSLNLAGIQVDHHKYLHLQWNMASVEEDTWILPKPIVVQVRINGQLAWALVDSRSLGDFMSSTLADQLKVKRETLDAPLGLQLTVQGFSSKINATMEPRLQYQGIDATQHFDIINLNSYDVILGMPWLYQHSVCIGWNPARLLLVRTIQSLSKRGMIPSWWSIP